MIRCLILLFFFASVGHANNVTHLSRKTNSSFPRRAQEVIAKTVELIAVPLYPLVDAAAGLSWQQRLRAKDLIMRRDGIYAAQLARYQRHQSELTARYFYDFLLHYRIDGVSHIGTASSHAQPDDARLLSIGGKEINIAQQVSGVLVWNHVNYDKLVSFNLQDGQHLHSSGAGTIPEGVETVYGKVSGVFTDDYHLVDVRQVRKASGEIVELPYTPSFIVLRQALTSLNDKQGELRSLL